MPRLRGPARNGPPSFPRLRAASWHASSRGARTWAVGERCWPGSWSGRACCWGRVSACRRRSPRSSSGCCSCSSRGAHRRGWAPRQPCWRWRAPHARAAPDSARCWTASGRRWRAVATSTTSARASRSPRRARPGSPWRSSRYGARVPRWSWAPGCACVCRRGRRRNGVTSWTRWCGWIRQGRRATRAASTASPSPTPRRSPRRAARSSRGPVPRPCRARGRARPWRGGGGASSAGSTPGSRPRRASWSCRSSRATAPRSRPDSTRTCAPRG